MVSLRKNWQVKIRLFRVLSAIVQSKFSMYKLFLHIMMLLMSCFTIAELSVNYMQLHRLHNTYCILLETLALAT